MSSPDISSQNAGVPNYAHYQVPQGTQESSGELTTQQAAQVLRQITPDQLDSLEKFSRLNDAEKTNVIKSLIGSPSLSPPSNDAAEQPMSPAGGNPWSSPSGFVAVLIALSNVAAVLTRNAVSDNKAIIQGEKAQYEMGVEAGKMAKEAKYAEAMADIMQGVGQIIAGAVGFAVVGAIGVQAAKASSTPSPHRDQADAVGGQMTSHRDQQLAKAKAERDEIAGDKSLTQEQKAEKLADKEAQVKTLEADSNAYATASDKQKARMDDKLAEKDPAFANLKQQRDKHEMDHQSFVASKTQNDRQIITLVGDSLKSIAAGSGQMMGAPFKMEQGEAEMWQAIYQAAGQIMGNFVTAFQNDMQSQQQMLDAVYQLQQKASDQYQQATSSHA